MPRLLKFFPTQTMKRKIALLRFRDKSWSALCSSLRRKTERRNVKIEKYGAVSRCISTCLLLPVCPVFNNEPDGTGLLVLVKDAGILLC